MNGINADIFAVYSYGNVRCPLNSASVVYKIG
jgi:hypothetical protein